MRFQPGGGSGQVPPKAGQVLVTPRTPPHRHSYSTTQSYTHVRLPSATEFRNNHILHLFIFCLLPKESETVQRLSPPPTGAWLGRTVYLPCGTVVDEGSLSGKCLCLNKHWP